MHCELSIYFCFSICVTGNPRPSINWVKVNGAMSRDVIIDGSKLIFPSITQSDQGTYRCVASSATGTIYKQVFITVEGQFDSFYSSRVSYKPGLLLVSLLFLFIYLFIYLFIKAPYNETSI